MRPDDDTLPHLTGTGDHDNAQGTDDTDPGDLDSDDLDDLDPDGAPCLVCGQTVPGPSPALLCPDCSAAVGTAAAAPDGP